MWLLKRLDNLITMKQNWSKQKRSPILNVNVLFPFQASFCSFLLLKIVIILYIYFAVCFLSDCSSTIVLRLCKHSDCHFWHFQVAGLHVSGAFPMWTLWKGHSFSFAFQMVQNFQDESCFILSTLKGKAHLPLSWFNWNMLAVPPGVGTSVRGLLAQRSHQEHPLGRKNMSVCETQA